MAIDPLELRNILLGKLSAAGFDTSSKTQDYWYALCKGLVTKFDSGGDPTAGIVSDTYKVKSEGSDTPDYLQGKLGDTATITWAYNAGTGKMEATGAATGQYDFIPFWESTLNSNKAIWGVRVDRACSYPAGLTGSYATATTAALAECILTIKKNGTSVGTITWAAAGTVATLAMAAQLDLVAGDLLQIWTPLVADAQLAGVTISLKGAQV